MKEESSYLPDSVIPEKVEKKKIVKKVRFHDDDPVVVTAQDKPQYLQAAKVGTKRLLSKQTELEQEEEVDEDQLLEEQCEKDFEALE